MTWKKTYSRFRFDVDVAVWLPVFMMRGLTVFWFMAEARSNDEMTVR